VLLTLLNTVLQRQGFRVWLAPGGLPALEVYRRHQSQIGVVLLDVRMPGLDGPRTLTELRRLNPDVACCFMSGHTGVYSDDDLRGLGAVHCFAKPFHVHDVAEFLWQTARPPLPHNHPLPVVTSQQDEGGPGSNETLPEI
jgi:CheY-like chemotaxis protein